MSVWIAPAASSAVWPLRSVHARVSCSPAVKNVIRSSARREPPRDVVERRLAAVAVRGRLLVGKLGELGLELQVDAARAVHDRDQRLRRQRLELAGQAPRVVGERRRPHRRAPGSFRSSSTSARSFAVAGLRLLLDPLEPTLDVVAVGDEQLELERLEVVVRRRVRPRSRGARRAARRPAEGSRAAPHRPRDVLHAHRRRRDLARLHDLGERARAARRRSAPCRRSSSRIRRRPSSSAQ